MKVILTENVKSLGNVGEIVNVSPGYARNFLVPQNFAVIADESNTKQMHDHQRRLAKKVEEAKKAAQDTAAKVNGLTVEMIKRVGANGRLFGTVTNTELATELGKQGVTIERRHITIDTPIKTLGTFDVKAKLFEGVEAIFKVKVDMSEKQAEEFKKKQAAAEKKAAAKKEAPAETTEEKATEETTEA
jgi:large subunit ribosomal protein L9